MRGIFIHIKTKPEDFINLPPPQEKIQFPTNINSKYSYSNNELLEILIKFYQKNKRPPRKRELGSYSNTPSDWMYRSRFGGLIQACKLAGIPIKKYTKEEALK